MGEAPITPTGDSSALSRLAGQDPAAALRAAAGQVLAALPGLDPGAVVATPRGPLPAEQLLGMALIEPVVHGWDLAVATGQPGTLDPELTAVLLPAVEQLGGAARGYRPVRSRSAVREVKMFGGLSFLVNDSMVVSASSDGGLLVRADPEQAGELLETKGAQPAEMGAGRAMGNSWISVAGETIASGDSFDFWIGVALEYNEKETGKRSRGRRRNEP